MRIVSTESIINDIAQGLIFTKTSIELLRELIYNMEKYKADGELKKQCVMEAFRRLKPLVSNPEDFENVYKIAESLIDIIVFTANHAREFKKACCK